MEKFFNSDSAYEKWVRKNKKKKNAQHNESEKKRYLKGLKGRVQNNLSGFLRVLVTALIVFLQVLLIIFLPFLLRQFTVLDIHCTSFADKRFFYVLSLGKIK